MPHETIIFTKSHKDWSKIVDFSLMANFWTCLVFFAQTLVLFEKSINKKLWNCLQWPITFKVKIFGVLIISKSIFSVNACTRNPRWKKCAPPSIKPCYYYDNSSTSPYPDCVTTFVCCCCGLYCTQKWVCMIEQCRATFF